MQRRPDGGAVANNAKQTVCAGRTRPGPRTIRPHRHSCSDPQGIYDDDHPIIGGHTPDAPPQAITVTSVILAATSAMLSTTTSLTPANDENIPNGPSNTTLSTTAPSTSTVGSIPNCSHSDRTFTSHIDLVGHS
ncbi:hypothetical protein SprV_0401506200 [Sparganum proliferum]